MSFFWTTVHLFCKTVLLSVILLGIFFLLDTFLFSKEGKPKPAPQSNEKLGLDGKVNLLLLIGRRHLGTHVRHLEARIRLRNLRHAH